MARVARYGDKATGICSRHKYPLTTTGIVIAPMEGVTADGVAVAHLGDKVQATCGHFGMIVDCSTTVVANNRPLARLGDKVVGDFKGTIVSGCPTVDSA